MEWAILHVLARRSFSYAAPVTRNNLPADVMLCNNESSFKKRLKTFLFNTCFYAAWLTPLQRLSSPRVMALYKYVHDYDYDLFPSGRVHITAHWPVLISRPTEGRRLSWPVARQYRCHCWPNGVRALKVIWTNKKGIYQYHPHRHSSSPRLFLFTLLINTLPGPSASQVTI